jgi:hypothetical protein
MSDKPKHDPSPRRFVLGVIFCCIAWSVILSTALGWYQRHYGYDVESNRAEGTSKDDAEAGWNSGPNPSCLAVLPGTNLRGT